MDLAGKRAVIDVENDGVLVLNLASVAQVSFAANPAPVEPLPAIAPAMALAREKQAFMTCVPPAPRTKH